MEALAQKPNLELLPNLADTLIAVAKQHPYFHLKDGESGKIYMERYWLMPFDSNAEQNIRIHHTMRSDTDRALHDHPWPSTSIILKGGFYEITPKDQAQHPSLDDTHFKREWRKPGDVIRRSATDRHRLEIPPGGSCWTMFIMGKAEKDWGFYDKNDGYIYWRMYLNDWSTVTASDNKTM